SPEPAPAAVRLPLPPALPRGHAALLERRAPPPPSGRPTHRLPPVRSRVAAAFRPPPARSPSATTAPAQILLAGKGFREPPPLAPELLTSEVVLSSARGTHVDQDRWIAS